MTIVRQGPLSGLLVVALEQAVAAPYCTSRLADAGARVIKIERSEGDFARGYDRVAHGESAYFVWLNRGKESVTLDIKSDADRAFLARIIARADIFVQNLAPGAAARAGFGSAQLRAAHPKLITCDISGYGEDGPFQNRKAYDFLLQCETGLAAITGAPEAPGRVGVSVCDIAAGMYAHAGLLEALLERAQTGQGAGISVSLFDAMAEWMNVPLIHYDYGGKAPVRVGLNHPSIAPYGAYRGKDGRFVVLSIQNEREWAQFCAQVLGQPETASSASFADNSARVANREALDHRIDAVFMTLSHVDLCARLEKAGIAFASFNEVADLSTHPQLRRIAVDTPSGPVEMAAPALRTQSARDYGTVPAAGQNSQAIREEFA